MTVSPSTFDTNDIGDNTVTLTVIDESGNSVDCSAVVTVEQETLNNPIFTIRDLSVIPNPFKNYFDIVLPDVFSINDFTINIYDINGRVVFKKVAISINGKIRIDNLDNIDQATYFVKITHNNSGNEIIKKMVRF